jgi:hypothetical protein
MAGMKRELLEAEDRRRRAATLGEIASTGIDVFCWCNRCGHNAVLHAERLVAELGPGYPVRPRWGRACAVPGAAPRTSRPARPGPASAK